MSFRDYQRAFTAHIRDPRGAPRPAGVPARRMRVYNELLYNNIENFLLACFPVCRKVLGKRRWSRLVRDFFRGHACATPFFRRIPEEFLDYLATSWSDSGDGPDFLPELAHYEWVELELETSDADARLPACDASGDLLAGRPLLNPVLRVLAYRYPVHRLSSRYRPVEAPAEPTFLLAFRDAGLKVRFEHVSAATARLLDILADAGAPTGREALVRLAVELGQPGDAGLDRHGRELLDGLRDRGAILGVRTASSPGS